MFNQFSNVKQVASNIPQQGECSSYTKTMFYEDFPQFTKVEVVIDENNVKTEVRKEIAPSAIVDMFVEECKRVILPSKWKTMWRYNSGLYVAHHLTMYLSTYKDSSDDAEDVVSGSSRNGELTSASLGDASVGYDNKVITEQALKWGVYNQTEYGKLLITNARLVGMGGSYVI